MGEFARVKERRGLPDSLRVGAASDLDIEHQIGLGQGLTGQYISGLELLAAERVAEGRDSLDFTGNQARSARPAGADRAVVRIGDSLGERAFEHRGTRGPIEGVTRRLDFDGAENGRAAGGGKGWQEG